MKLLFKFMGDRKAWKPFEVFFCFEKGLMGGGCGIELIIKSFSFY